MGSEKILTPKVYTLDEIEKALSGIDVVAAIESGFVAYSAGDVVIPPVCELLFPEHVGEMHIKCGAVKGDSVAVVKIATGYTNNPSQGLPPFSGCMIVFDQRTGMLSAVLLEEGVLTNHRTAAAGAVAAKYLAPKQVCRIGIIGTGVQARIQADYLRRVTDCRDVRLMGRSAEKSKIAARALEVMGFNVEITDDADMLAQISNLIVTTTAAHHPILSARCVQPGTHITAIGSDTPNKHELDPKLLKMADLVVSDSLSQCKERGEIFQAVAAGYLDWARVVELGAIIADPKIGRRDQTSISIADLTGVGIQDIAIAKAVLSNL